jgi:hypothetical protein
MVSQQSDDIAVAAAVPCMLKLCQESSAAVADVLAFNTWNEQRPASVCNVNPSLGLVSKTCQLSK